MKRKLGIRCVVCWLCLGMAVGLMPGGQGSVRAQDIPGVGSITGLVNRAIKAIDLKIQRMQNKTIGLQSAQKVLENAMSKLHLRDMADWALRQKDLYEKYFQELWQVKAVLTGYWQVKEIIKRQVLLVSEYKIAWARLSTDRHFTALELNQMYRIYSGVLEEGLRNLDQLTVACSAFTTQMSDGKRMQLIESAGKSIEQNLADLRSFNNSNVRLSLSRAADLADALMTKRIYGLQ